MRILLALLLAFAPALAHAEKHVVLMVPILAAADSEGVQRARGVTFRPSVRTVVTAGKRAAAIRGGMAIRLAEALEASEEEMLGVLEPSVRYHMIVPDRFDHVAAGAVYAAKWDGKAPYVEVLVGDVHEITHAFMGWPMLTKAEWEAANPPVVEIGGQR